MKQKLWVVTEEINEYNQEGDYLVAVFIDKPTVEDLMNTNTFTKPQAEHLVTGGGKVGTEDCWCHLTELEVGAVYSREPSHYCFREAIRKSD